MNASENPYASPAAGVSPLESLGRHDFRSHGQLVKWLTVLLVANIVFGLLFAVLGLLEATVFAEFIVPDEIDDTAAMTFYLAMGATAMLFLPLRIITVVLFCVWIYRANRNARALGATGMQFTPGWSVGWFFVPIMNLFRPYQAASEIYRASDPEADVTNWTSSSVPAFFGLWWFFWIVGNVLGNVEGRMGFSSDPSVAVAGSWLAVFNGLWEFPTALLAILVVRGIHNRQERKAAKVPVT